jgi:ketosteroid isomerase-like protein
MKPGIARSLIAALALALIAISVAAQKETKSAAGESVDKAYLQKIWDGWATLDTANVKAYYAQGPYVFFDIAPVKYSSWDEYQNGVARELADYKSARFKLNDDTQIHQSGAAHWVTSTLAFEMTRKSGKIEMGTMRWTAVFEKHSGNWLIVHEHVSVPMQ